MILSCVLKEISGSLHYCSAYICLHHSFMGDDRVLTLRIITSANFDISALGMLDNKNTSIFNQMYVFFPFFTDLQPVKIQLNNLLCSTFPLLWYMHNTHDGIKAV